MDDIRLDGTRVAILVTDGFEEVELADPRRALDAAGAETIIVSPKRDTVRAWRFTEWGDELPVDVPLAKAHRDDFDALLLPGGVINPDQLRMDEDAVAFAQAFLDENKPVASICHGPWLLIETRRVEGRPRGPHSRRTSRMPGHSGKTSTPSSMATWSPAEARRISRLSIAR